MDGRKNAVLALTDKVLLEAVRDYSHMEVYKVNGELDSVDLFIGKGKINVRIAFDSPLAIFKDIAKAIHY